MNKNTSDTKNYIIDTNVLLHDPRALFHFKNNNIVIPFGVIEEIDTFKRDLSDLGRNAREVCRYLDKLREKGSLADGVKMDSGGSVRVIMSGSNGNNHVDKQIIETAKSLKSENQSQTYIVVTKDINLRIRADVQGVPAENYDAVKTNLDDICINYPEIKIPTCDFERVSAGDPVKVPLRGIITNQYVVLKSADDETKTVLARIKEDKQAHCLRRTPKAFKNISPINMEQCFALDALLDDQIQLVSLIGKAGTGKTLLGVVTGVYKTFVEKKYSRLVVTKPVMPIGRDIGYLPGDIHDKMSPWVQSVFDALEFIHDDKALERKDVEDRVVVEPITYMRGRNFHNSFIIVDEAQNLSPMEIKTVITRVGMNSKVVLTGDINQIDNPYVDSMNNGLSVVANKFRNNSMCTHVHFSKGVRSKLAELAANTL